MAPLVVIGAVTDTGRFIVREGDEIVADMPASTLAGDAPIYDPASTRLAPSGSGYVRDLFPSNIIPQNRFSGVATRFIALRPANMLPTNNGNSFGDPVNNYITDTGTTSSSAARRMLSCASPVDGGESNMT